MVDASFCEYACQKDIDIAKRLNDVLQGNAKPMMTQCSIVQLYKLGPSGQRIVDVAKRFERRKCNHTEAIDGDECIKSVIGPTNKHRYVIATLSEDLRSSLRLISAVPIIHMNRVVVVMEPPSDATLHAKSLADSASQGASTSEIAKIAANKPEEPPKRVKKRAKGPNPLSVKKKKRKDISPLPKTMKGRKTQPNTSKNEEGIARAGEKRPLLVEEDDITSAEAAVSGPSSRGHRKKRRRRGGITSDTSKALDSSGED